MKQKLLFGNRIKMLSLKVFSLVLLFVTQQSIAQTVTGNTQGTNNGFFYSFWNDNSSGSASMTLGAAGAYSTTWSSVGNFTAGKGWATGSANRVICFSGSFNGGNNGYLAIYGWTKNALIEYYVVENHGGYTPPGGTSLGSFTSDGGTYNVYKAQRVNAPNITGTNTTFYQYWSVRTTTRSSGTVTFANHVAAWASHGMAMGTTWDYQILETEGYQSSGSSSVTVSDCSTSNPTPTVSITAPANASSVCAGTSVSITATASVSSGSISSVDFYDGTTLLGSDNSSPYSYTWTNPSAGAHTVNVIANSAAGVASTTAAISLTVNAIPSPPTVVTPVTYCTGATATALGATGTALKWYTAATGGTALTGAPTPSTANTGTTNYYVTQTTNTCESNRAMIAVTVNTAPGAPTVATPVTYCQNATATALTATGTTLKWYTVATGGTGSATSPTPATTTAGTTNYYVTQSTGTCESVRAMIAVTVNTAPGAPTVTTPVTYCQNATATALTATGTTLKWYTVATGGTGSATAPTPATTTAGTTNYYVTQSTGTCESVRAMIAVTVNTAPGAPTVSTPVNYCQNATATALTATGTTLKWYTVATGGTGSPTAPTPVTTTAGTTNYYVTQSTGTCESVRAMIAVTVNTAPAAPMVTTPVTYCQNATATALSATGTALKWYSVASGGTALAGAPTPSTTTAATTTYYVSQTTGCESSRAAIDVIVNATPSAPIVVTPVTYCVGTTATALSATGTALQWYSAASGGTALTGAPVPSTTTAATTTYYVSQTTGCESSRAAIDVIVNAAPSAPTVVTPVTYCVGTTATALSANGAALKWYSVASGGTALTNAPVPSTTTAATTTYYVSQTTGCESSRAAIDVIVNAAPSAPTVVSPVTYCVGTTATALSATGTALQWYNVASGGTALTGAPVPSTTIAGTTDYYVTQTIAACESERAMIEVTVNGLPIALITTTTPTTICQGGSVLLTSSTGSSYVWKSGAGTIGTGQTYSATSTGSYTVEVSNVSGCKTTSAATTVTVAAPTTWYADTDGDGAGDPNTTLSACAMPAGYISTAGDLCPADGNKMAPGNCGCGKTETSCLDCAGVPNGSAKIDVCNICSGGTTGITPITSPANCTTTGVLSLLASGLKIYPNPYEQDITVTVAEGTFSLTLYTSAGVEVLKGTYNKQAIIGHDLNPGIYMMRIEQSGSMEMRKIIKK